MTRLRRLCDVVAGVLRRPRQTGGHLLRWSETSRAQEFCRQWNARASAGPAPPLSADVDTSDPTNTLSAYFAAHTAGPGVWKWLHYFDIYHRHLSKFIGRDAHIVEVGVQSGGSLLMWKHYFGPSCLVTGVDLDEACRAHEGDGIRVVIGDQSDRGFWKTFTAEMPAVDVLIDDGTAKADGQIVTLEEILPHLRPGGVYLCEDVYRLGNRFAAYVYSLANHLNAFDSVSTWPALGAGRARLIASRPTPFQSGVYSVHLYPFVVVIEKPAAPVHHLVSAGHGSEWH